MPFLYEVISAASIAWLMAVQGDRELMKLPAWDGSLTSLVIPPSKSTTTPSAAAAAHSPSQLHAGLEIRYPHTAAPFPASSVHQASSSFGVLCWFALVSIFFLTVALGWFLTAGEMNGKYYGDLSFLNQGEDDGDRNSGASDSAPFDGSEDPDVEKPSPSDQPEGQKFYGDLMFLNQGRNEENGTSVAGDSSAPDGSEDSNAADASPSDPSEDSNVADTPSFDWVTFLSSEEGGKFLEELFLLTQAGDQESGASVAGNAPPPPSGSEDPHAATTSPFDWLSFLSSEKGGKFLEDLLFLTQGGAEGSGASVAGDASPPGGSEDPNAAATSPFRWSTLLSGEESGKFFGDLLFLHEDGDGGSAIPGAEDTSSDRPEGPDTADASSFGGSGPASHQESEFFGDLLFL